MLISLQGPGRAALLPLLILPLLAAAAPTPAPEEGTAEPPPPPAGRETLAKDSIIRVLGSDVKGPSGIVVGQIVNVLVDPNGQPLCAVMDYGGFLGVGKRRIAVAWPMLGFDKGGITLSLSRDQLRNFPDFRDGEDAIIATNPAPPG